MAAFEMTFDLLTLAWHAQIVLDDSEPMERASWFLQGTDRLQAELLLCKQGQWLVRQKAGDTTSVLSVLWAGKPRHYKLFFLPDKGYSTGGNSCVFFTTVVCLSPAGVFYQFLAVLTEGIYGHQPLGYVSILGGAAAVLHERAAAKK